MAAKKITSYIDSTMKKGDLFIKLKTTKLDDKHQFVCAHSGIYDCKEYIWEGTLRTGSTFTLRNEKNELVPNPNAYCEYSGPGFTFDDEKTCNELNVNDALVIKADENLIYAYTNEKSSLTYLGKTRKVTLFVRVYDDNNGNANSRWLAINLK